MLFIYGTKKWILGFKQILNGFMGIESGFKTKLKPRTHYFCVLTYKFPVS